MRLTALTLSILLGVTLLQVVAAVLPNPTKPGICPAFPLLRSPCPPVKPEEHRECFNDMDCDGIKKCCPDGCQMKCKDPAVPKPGNCPAVTLPLRPCPRPERPYEGCQSDKQCKGKQKCCHDGCQMMCKDPEVPTKPPKPGNCPAVPLPLRPCRRPERPYEGCRSDEQCKGKQKCCHDGCQMMCKDPEVPKPGNCPAVTLPLRPCPRPERPYEGCQSDKQCKGKQKCCHDGCQMMCKDPAVLKPGICPAVTLPLRSCPRPERPYEGCRSDKQCKGKQKCCHDGCQMMCKDPEVPTKPPKAGKCPFSPIPFVPCHMQTQEIQHQCNSDQDCDGKKKCCLFICQMKCEDPEVLKPGICPAVPLPPRPCPRPERPTEGCRSDKQCKGKQKCCHDGCQMMCKDPEVPKPGNCPPVPLPLRPCPLPERPTEGCQSDKQCKGKQKCCHDGCQMMCKDPEE